MNKEIFKKTGEELQDFLAFRKRANRIESKKGKGSYNRQKFKCYRQRSKSGILHCGIEIFTFSIIA